MSNGQLNLATIARYYLLRSLSLAHTCVRAYPYNHLKKCRIRRVDSKHVYYNWIVVPCSAFLGVFAVSSSFYMYLYA